MIETALVRAGETHVLKIRERARQIAPQLGMEKAFERLDAIVGDCARR